MEATRRKNQLIGINWTTRLTLILVWTSILFSLFFGLEFFISKLANMLQVQASEAPDIQVDVNWTSSSRGNEVRQSKFGLNFDLIYENELQISQDGKHFVVAAQNGDLLRHEIRSDLKLKRIFEAHHLAMPFDPDIWKLSEPEEQIHLLSGNLSDCLKDLGRLEAEVTKLLAGPKNEPNFGPLSKLGWREYQLMQLIDSFGRPEAGTLNGHPFWLGSYLSCLQVGSSGLNLGADEEAPLKTRYCVGKVTLNSWSRAEPIELTLQDRGELLALIKLGLCLPQSCDSLELLRQSEALRDIEIEQQLSQYLQLAKNLAMRNFNEQIYPRDQVNLVDIYCLPDEHKRPLSLVGLLLMLFLLNWLMFSLLATWLRLKRRTGDSGELDFGFLSDELLEIMAIDVNLKHFLSLDEKEHAKASVNLNVLDSVKHLGCMGVIAAHVLLTYLTLGTAYSHSMEVIGKDMRTMLMLSLNNVVDTFFVISGLLVAYLTFKKSDSKADERRTANSPPVAYLKLIAGRYLRIAPLYFLVYAYTKSLASHLGSGPLWDYATSAESLRGLCRRESWLWPLTFSSDFKPITHHCVPPAWSLAVDFHFFLVLPLLILVLKRVRPTKLAYLLLGGLILASTYLTMRDYQSLLTYVSLRDFANLRLHVFTVLIRYAAHAYSQPQNRVGPILIGLVGGHLLFRYERRLARLASGKRSSGSAAACAGSRNDAGDLCQGGHSNVEQQAIGWPKWMRGRLFAAILVASCLLMLAPLLVQLRQRLAVTSSVEFDCHLALGGFLLIKPLWSLCNCVLFLRLVTADQSKLIVRLMSLKIWSKLSKLNYAILLVHFELIAYDSMSQLQLAPITWPNLLNKFAFAYLGSLVLALPLYLLLERPIQRLVGWKLLRSGQFKRNNNNSNKLHSKSS